MTLITENFLLQSKAAERLYHDYAAPQPIFDYHCHLVPQMIASNRRFADLFEIWLEGDHYKWRAMRACGEPERFCTGDAAPYDKFLAWARTVPSTLRNPLYHWTHLELQRYFNITELLNEDSAPRIWQQANEVLQTLDVHAILAKFKVHTIGTTDDPTDSLEHHQQIAACNLPTRVVPTFRPDAALKVDQPESWNAWVNRLAAAVNTEITTFQHFLRAIEQRQHFFHTLGCRMSDHGLDVAYAGDCSESQAAAIFLATRAGQPASPADHHAFASFLMFYLGQLYARSNWTMQLHLGALRNPNSRAKAIHGPDTGFDTMGGATAHGPSRGLAQLPAVAAFLDRLESANSLPKTILYNSNPLENYAFATLTGSFSQEGVPGKIQFGSGWWFLDQKEGIELQLNALSNVSLLSRFVGMVTDSRSFMSYPRHEYFRRVLCNLLGSEIERGLLPGDFNLVGKMVSDICFHNAHRYANIPALQQSSLPA